MRRESFACPAIDGCFARLSCSRRQAAGPPVAAARAGSNQSNDVVVSMGGPWQCAAEAESLRRPGYGCATEKVAPLVAGPNARQAIVALPREWGGSGRRCTR